jgi:hypothetical protein
MPISKIIYIQNKFSNATLKCSLNGNIIQVLNAYNDIAYSSLSDFTIIVLNIINPSPSGTYTPLISISIVQPGGIVFDSGISGITINIKPDVANCSLSFDNAYVSQISQITINYISNQIPNNTNGY